MGGGRDVEGPTSLVVRADNCRRRHTLEVEETRWREREYEKEALGQVFNFRAAHWVENIMIF